MAQPHTRQAQDQGQDRISPSAEPLSIFSEIQRLEAEGRKCGVASAYSEHEELSESARHKETPIRRCERGKQADDERSRDINDQCSPRESLTEAIGKKS